MTGSKQGNDTGTSRIYEISKKPPQIAKQMENFDVVIVGAGISGIGTAYWLQEKCTGKTYAILEARERLGGTWDLFRYPGIRSRIARKRPGFRRANLCYTINEHPYCLDKVR